MRIEIRKFGEFLISRPAGKEALAVILAYQVPPTQTEKIELDFTGVKAMGPSWLDEVLTGLKSAYGSQRIVCLSTNNQSVIESLKAIQ